MAAAEMAAAFCLSYESVLRHYLRQVRRGKPRVRTADF